jgi:asparagine synthase (glutamine-hydrolysing)
MCGIAGFKINDIEIDIEQLKKDLYHRGPDHFGHSIFNGYFICNARLKIQDLHAGYQPFISDDKNYALVYNGELYNKEEIKSKLKGDYNFKSNSDTEIVFYALIENGIDIIKKFNGMFGLCFYDLKSNQLYLARDRFGVKPLYFFKDGHDFSFASEMRALKNIIPYKNLNLSAIKSYLQTNYIHDDDAIYEQCEIVKAGEYVKLDIAQFKISRHKYWDLTISEENDFNPEKLDFLLNQAVQRQLISDRKVGIYLSSGIDSATMAYYASKHLDQVDAYTIGFNHKDFDESPLAEKVAKDLNINFHRYEFSHENFIDTINEYSTYTSSPIADLGMYPLYYLSKFVADSSTVLLSGDGGDEIFGGYPTIKASLLHHKYKSILKLGLAPLKSSLPLLKKLNSKSSWDYRFNKFYKGLNYSNNYAHYFWRTVFDNEELKALGFESQYDNSLYYQRFLEKYDIPQNYFYADFKVWLVCNNFIKVDIASMASSIEARVPFLDNDLIDYAFSIKMNQKWNLNSNKLMLRKTMKDKLPSYIVDGKKAAFHPPYFKWFREELYSFLQENLINQSLVNKLGLDNNEIEKILKEHKTEKVNNTYKIFNLLLLEFWLRNH